MSATLESIDQKLDIALGAIKILAEKIGDVSVMAELGSELRNIEENRRLIELSATDPEAFKALNAKVMRERRAKRNRRTMAVISPGGM